MSYLVIEDFRAGMDRRRSIETGIPGSAWDIKNAHITRGGEIEKRKAFVADQALFDADTFGLHTVNNQLYTFGSAASPSVPGNVTYQQLVHSTNNMVKLHAAENFNGKIFAIAEYDNGDLRAFYDGAMVAEYTTLPDKPYAALTFKSKIYAPSNSLLRFCSVDSPTLWSTGTGYGLTNLSNHDSGSENLTQAAAYQGKLAIFSRNVIQIWHVESDPANNSYIQTLRRTGTRAPKSVESYGDTDVFYLSDTGVRSIRARDSSNAAYVDDVGTAIDDFVREHLAAVTEADVKAAVAMTDPLDGRYWLAIGSKIFVFSYFPGSKISAWSYYEPGFKVTDFALIGNSVYARGDDNKLYQYGGISNNEYDSSRVEVLLPFLTANKPGTSKSFYGIDIAADNIWNAKLLVNPKDLDAYVEFGDLDGFTYNDADASANVSATHAAPLLACEQPGYAKLANASIHYSMEASE